MDMYTRFDQIDTIGLGLVTQTSTLLPRSPDRRYLKWLRNNCLIQFLALERPSSAAAQQTNQINRSENIDQMRTEVMVDREWPRRVFEDSRGWQIEELDDNCNGTEEDRESDIEDNESMIFVIACEQPYDEVSRRRLQREEVLFVPERNQMHDVNPSIETHPAGNSLDNNQSRIKSV
jgi:hypothetical protein